MSKQISSIHDAFFKQALSDPVLACTFLREHLPEEISSLLGPEAPELMSGSFVDEDLRQSQSDLLYRVHLKVDGDAFAYVLVEHKSSPDSGARLQLLRYVVRLLTDLYERNEKQLPLPPVLPLLVHQGPKGWNFSCEFTDLFGSVPEALRPYVPSFRHALVDLGSMNDTALSCQVRLRAFLKALKYSRRLDLPAFIGVVLAEAPWLEQKDLVGILTYLGKGPVAVDDSVIEATLLRLMPERKEWIMGSIGQPYYEKGLAEGRAEGRAEGEVREAKGQAKVLALLVEERFGEIPASLRERIFAADVTSLDTWVRRFLNARDLRSVFEPN